MTLTERLASTLNDDPDLLSSARWHLAGIQAEELRDESLNSMTRLLMDGGLPSYGDMSAEDAAQALVDQYEDEVEGDETAQMIAILDSIKE